MGNTGIKRQLMTSPIIRSKTPLPLWVRLAMASAVIILSCFALSLTAQAQLPSPSPDGGYPNGNTAEGTRALFSLTTGGQSPCCLPQFYRERVFGSFSHRNLRFGENQVWRFALSMCTFEVEKEKWGLLIDSAGGSGVINGETLASCKRGVFTNEERAAPVRNRFSITLSRSKGGSSEKETNIRSNRASSSFWRGS
jgi:hypothetical protein